MRQCTDSIGTVRGTSLKCQPIPLDSPPRSNYFLRRFQDRQVETVSLTFRKMNLQRGETAGEVISTT